MSDTLQAWDMLTSYNVDCETETSKCFECKAFRLFQFELQIWLRAITMSYNDEPVKKPYKLESFVVNTCICVFTQFHRGQPLSSLTQWVS